MNSIPIISIEIEGMRESIRQQLMIHSKELAEMTNAAIDHAFSTRNIQAQIQQEVDKTVDEAIASLSTDFNIKYIIKRIVLDALTTRAEDLNKEGLCK